jgi:hypothetical protein
MTCAEEVWTVPCISRSFAVEFARSQRYQVPAALVPPQLTIRNVTVVPGATFWSAAIPDRSIAPIEPPDARLTV